MRPLGARTVRDFLVQAEAEDVQHLQVQRVVDRDAQLAVLLAQGQDQVLAHQVVGDLVDGVGRDACSCRGRCIPCCAAAARAL